MDTMRYFYCFCSLVFMRECVCGAHAHALRELFRHLRLTLKPLTVEQGRTQYDLLDYIISVI